MDLAFLLVVAKPGARLPAHHLEVAGAPRPSGLHFTADRHEHWSDASGRVVLACWRSTGDKRTAGAWSSDERGVAVTTGPVRIARRPWATDGRWAEECTGHLSAAKALDELRGVFSLVSLATDGDGVVASDPLGLSFTYVGEDPTSTVISSRAALVAAAITPPGARPALDALGVCGLAYSACRIGDRTGFAGVRTLGAGTVVTISAERGAEVVDQPPPWMTGDRDGETALDVVMDEISEIVTSTLTLPASRPIADLTGGRDSRLVLAAALHAGVADRFTFRTDGPPELPDVQVAERLARDLGLSYESSLRMPAGHRRYEERLHTFVEVTGGITNAWDVKAPTGGFGAVRLSGANGECLRAQAVLDPPPLSPEHLVRLFDDTFRFGQLELLHPEVAFQYREEALSVLMSEPSGRTHALDLLESFQIRTRARARYGPLDELERAHRVLGLYSITAIRAAFSLPPLDRHTGRVHHELMQRASPVLTRHPFAGSAASQRLRPRSHDAHRSTSPASAMTIPLMARLRMSNLDDHRPALEAVLADERNPAWDLIDRQRAIDALARGSTLARPERAELYGAVTAAIWLARP